MKHAMTAFSFFVLGLGLAASTPAQIKEMAGDSVTVSGTVEAIDHTSRVLTLKNEKGDMVTLDVPSDVKRFPEIKVGDKITARYYDNVTVRLKKPGEAAVNTGAAAVTPGTGAKPAKTVASQRTMTAIDRGDRPEGSVDHVQGTTGVEIQPPRPGQGRAEAGEGRRPGRLHVDRGRADLGR